MLRVLTPPPNNYYNNNNYEGKTTLSNNVGFHNNNINNCEYEINKIYESAEYKRRYNINKYKKANFDKQLNLFVKEIEDLEKQLNRKKELLNEILEEDVLTQKLKCLYIRMQVGEDCRPAIKECIENVGGTRKQKYKHICKKRKTIHKRKSKK